MRAYELFEYNQDSLLKTFQDRLINKWKREGKPFADQIGDEGDKDFLDNFMKWFEQYDPTQNKKYMTWLVGKYAGKKGGINRLEDIPARAHELLIKYDRLAAKKKLKPEDKNINQIKTLSDLGGILQDEDYQDEDLSSQKEKSDEIEQEMYDDGDAELVYNDSDYKVVIAVTHKASCYFGKNTQWCTTSAGSSSYHDQYSDQGPLYIILEKSTNTRWQFHFESGQYMDENDSQIDVASFFDEHPVMYELFEGLNIPQMKIFKVEEMVAKDGFTDEVADLLDTALRQKNIGVNNMILFDEDGKIIQIDEWSDFERFATDIDDKVLHQLASVYEDGIEDFNMEITEEDYIDLIKMLDDYHQKKLFAVSGTTDPEKTLLVLQRDGHKYFEQLENALEKSQNRPDDKLKKQIKDRIFQYIQVGIPFSSYHTYTNLNQAKTADEFDLDSPVKLLIGLSDLIGHAQSGDYDESGEYENYRIQEYGWAALETDGGGADYADERRQEEGLIDKDGNDNLLSTLSSEPDIESAFDIFRRMFIDEEDREDAEMLEELKRLANIQ